ncbi:MAG: AbrB/MazE/SpoVT family DNA-binding domain-containing protein [Thermodesulfobacteriota bacterium]|nr:AbrB/MazE/SpoVT family DNA-binding domain-containing protein [Thermodesulfobacteriota bacterium]
MLATVTSKGQITIPKTIRDAMSISFKDKIDFIIDGDRLVLKRVKTLKDLRGSIPSISGNIDNERQHARTAVSKRFIEEMK